MAYFYAFLDFTTGTDFIWGETPLLNSPIAEIKLIATCRVAYHCTVQEKIIASQVAIAAFIEVCRLAVYDYAQCGVCVCKLLTIRKIQAVQNVRNRSGFLSQQPLQYVVSIYVHMKFQQRCE